jgi:hypothetical protein
MKMGLDIRSAGVLCAFIRSLDVMLVTDRQISCHGRDIIPMDIKCIFTGSACKPHTSERRHQHADGICRYQSRDYVNKQQLDATPLRVTTSLHSG